MGLSAVVYKGLRNLPEELRTKLQIVDQLTGELQLIERPDDPISVFAAIEISLGNSAMIEFLRKEVLATLGDENSPILTTILYSGSHSGDTAPMHVVVEIQEDLKKLSAMSANTSGDMQHFISNIDRLVKCSIHEGNPIVFV